MMIFPQFGTAGESRVWVSHNILVEFNENGVVVSRREVEDKNLMREFVSWVQAQGRTVPDLSLLAQKSFFVIFVKTKAGFHYQGRGNMYVRPEGLEFIEQDTRKRFRVAINWIADSQLNPVPLIDRSGKLRDWKPYVELQLKFKNKTAWGKKVTVYINPPSLLLPVIRTIM